MNKPKFEFRIGRYWISRPRVGLIRIRKEDSKTIEFDEQEVEQMVKHLFDFRLMLIENQGKML